MRYTLPILVSPSRNVWVQLQLVCFDLPPSAKSIRYVYNLQVFNHVYTNHECIELRRKGVTGTEHIHCVLQICALRP